MIKTIRVSDKGQIAIPQKMRETMGIERGDNLIVIKIEGKILIEKAKQTEKKAEDNFKDILRFSEQSLKEVWGSKEDEIWREYLK